MEASAKAAEMEVYAKAEAKRLERNRKARERYANKKAAEAYARIQAEVAAEEARKAAVLAEEKKEEEEEEEEEYTGDNDYCPICNVLTNTKNCCMSRSCCKCLEITFCDECGKDCEDMDCSHDWETHWICCKCSE